MNDHERRKERVQMNVERVSPLDPFVGRHAAIEHEPVGDQPEAGGHHQADADAVHEDHEEQKLDERKEPQVQCDGEQGGTDYEPDGEQHEKGRIVAAVPIFGLLAVILIADHLARRDEQVELLPQSVLEVHVLKLEQSAHIAQQFGQSRQFVLGFRSPRLRDRLGQRRRRSAVFVHLCCGLTETHL